MPIMPTFTGFAPTPNVAEAYGVGARTRLGYAQIAQQAEEASARLAQQRQLAAMEMMAKEQQFQKEALLKQQELEIEKAYKEGTLRMQEGQLMATQGALALDTLKAQRKHEAAERIRAEIPQTPGDWRSTILRNLEAEVPGAAYGAVAAPRALIPPVRVVEPVTGKEFWQYEEGEPVRPEGRESTARTEAQRVLAERRRQLWDEIQDLQRQHAADTAGAINARDYLAKKKLSPIQEGIALAYLERETKIKKKMEDLRAMENEVLAPVPQAQLPPGMGGGVTNRVGRFEIITPGTNQPVY
jgi:hypothetical protein